MFDWLSKLRGQNSISGATKILIATLFLSNILGVVRDHFLAQKIPTTLLDSYFAAFRLPDLVFNILILGAISAAFIPVFTGLMAQKKQKQAFATANQLLSLGLTAVTVCLIILWFALPALIHYLVPDFSTEKQLLTYQLARLFLISPFLFTISYLFTGILNSFKHFTVTALAPLVYNLSIICATLLGADRWGVFAPAYGVVAGAFLHLAVQLPSVWRRGWRFKFYFNWRDQTILKILRLMLPRSISLGVFQFMLVGFTAIASSLRGGAVAIFSLADNIQTMPSVVFGASIASVIFPHLAENFTLHQRGRFILLLERAILMVLFFMIPMSVGIILLRAQIIRLILGSGHFGWEQTRLASAVLGVFSFGLIFAGLLPVLAKTFYARQNTRIPMASALFSALISLLAGWWLAQRWGIIGLAGAMSLFSILNSICLILALSNQGIKLKWLHLVINGIKILLASAVMGVVIQIVKEIYGAWFDLDHFIEVFGQVVLAAGLGLISFYILVKWLQVDKFSFKGLDQLRVKE